MRIRAMKNRKGVTLKYVVTYDPRMLHRWDCALVHQAKHYDQLDVATDDQSLTLPWCLRCLAVEGRQKSPIFAKEAS